MNLSLIQLVGQRSQRVLEASMECPWVGQNESQTKCYHYNKLEETTRYVPIGHSHQNDEFYSDRIIAPRDYSSVGLVVSTT